MNGGEYVAGLLFGRDVSTGQSTILRLVEFRGDLKELGRLGKALHPIMRQEGYEYIDMMVSDLPKEVMIKSGFSLLDPDGDIVIPIYFSSLLGKILRFIIKQVETS